MDELPDALVVRHRRRVVPAIVGLPFLAAAGYLWFGAWLIVASHARAGSLGAPAGYLPMVAFLLGVGAVFAWPGVRLTLHNQRVRLARMDRTVDVVHDYVVLRRVRRRPLSEFSRVTLGRHVEIATRPPRDSRVRLGPHRFMAVSLRSTLPGGDLAVAFDYDEARLRALARRVASYTGLAIDEDLAGERLG